MYFFFFNDTATTEIYTLSLHDALPISLRVHCRAIPRQAAGNVRGSARRCRALRGGLRGLRVRAATECGGNPQALSVLWRVVTATATRECAGRRPCGRRRLASPPCPTCRRRSGRRRGGPPS